MLEQVWRVLSIMFEYVIATSATLPGSVSDEIKIREPVEQTGTGLIQSIAAAIPWRPYVLPQGGGTERREVQQQTKTRSTFFR